jgi:hypothetical protein
MKTDLFTSYELSSMNAYLVTPPILLLTLRGIGMSTVRSMDYYPWLRNLFGVHRGKQLVAVFLPARYWIGVAWSTLL